MKTHQFLLLNLLFISLLLVPFNSVIANGQEVYPNNGNGWIKFDDLDGYSFTYTADEGYLVAESCYKASTDVVYQTYEPPIKTVVITTQDHEISHVSVRIVEEVTPPPEVTPTPDVSETPEVTPPPEVTPTPDVSETPEVTPPPEFTQTPEVTSSPKPTGEVITEVNTGANALPILFVVIGGLAALAVYLFRKQTVV